MTASLRPMSLWLPGAWKTQEAVSLREQVPKERRICHLCVCWVSSVCFPASLPALLHYFVTQWLHQWAPSHSGFWCPSANGEHRQEEEVGGEVKLFSLLVHLSAGRQWSGCWRLHFLMVILPIQISQLGFWKHFPTFGPSSVGSSCSEPEKGTQTKSFLERRVSAEAGKGMQSQVVTQSS